MGKLFASMTIDVSYNEEMPITIRRFPTEHEIKKLQKYSNKLVDEERITSDNEITIKLYNRQKTRFSKTISGGNYDFTHASSPGTYIDVKIKHAEKNLKNTVVEILRSLSTKHLEPCVLFPSRYSIACSINNFQLTKDIAENFLLDFTVELEKRIETFKITKHKEEIEYEDVEICERCGGKFAEEEMKSYPTYEKIVKYCPTCYDIVRKNSSDKDVSITEPDIPDYNESKSSIKLKWKIILIVLTIIACLSLILASGALL